MESVLSYCETTDTIRQLPQNYLIAQRKYTPFDDPAPWVMEPDLAADKDLVVRVTLALMEFDNKHAATGLKLLAAVTPNA